MQENQTIEQATTQAPTERVRDEDKVVGFFETIRDFAEAVKDKEVQEGAWGWVNGRVVFADEIEVELAAEAIATGNAAAPSDEDLTPVSASISYDEATFDAPGFVCQELEKAGYENPTDWLRDADQRMSDLTLPVKERIFFVNRALRLHMSEQVDRNHMEARMLIADGLELGDWVSIIVRGVVPWYMKALPARAMNKVAEDASNHTEVTLHQQVDVDCQAAPTQG